MKKFKYNMEVHGWLVIIIPEAIEDEMVEDFAKAYFAEANLGVLEDCEIIKISKTEQVAVEVQVKGYFNSEVEAVDLYSAESLADNEFCEADFGGLVDVEYVDWEFAEID